MFLLKLFICFGNQSTFAMNSKTDYLKDISEIKAIMQRSSRFISLSGLSGVSAGIYALVGAYLAYSLLYQETEFFSYKRVTTDYTTTIQLISIALGVLILSILTGIWLTTRKARKNKLPVWDQQAKRLLINLFIPLAAGGILCLIFINKGYIGIVAPLTLIFYGLALVNASKFTYSEIRSLGLMEITLGLLASHWIGFGLLFWAVGFGVLHIVYGGWMFFKYEK